MNLMKQTDAMLLLLSHVLLRMRAPARALDYLIGFQTKS